MYIVYYIVYMIVIFPDEFGCDIGTHLTMYILRCSLPYVLVCYWICGQHWGKIPMDNFMESAKYSNLAFLLFSSFDSLHLAEEHGSSIGHAQHPLQYTLFNLLLKSFRRKLLGNFLTSSYVYVMVTTLSKPLSTLTKFRP